jgi:hypothetical protein
MTVFCLNLRWPDGVASTSTHLTPRLLVRYLLSLHTSGDDVTILWLREHDQPWKLFWLSFVDPDRPEGERFLGVSVIQVSRAEKVAARLIVMKNFGECRPNADWYAAAIRKAWALGINPGGQIGITEISEVPANLPIDCALTPEQIAFFSKREAS